MINLLVDGNNLAHRCKYKFDLSNNGIDVSVTYGFIKVLSSTMSKLNADTTTVAWDWGIPEHRRAALPEYKANRIKNWEPEEFEDFNRQLDELHYILPDFGIMSVTRPACEADDILYQASRIFEGDSIIVSNDQDMWQAINDSTTVYNPNKDQILDALYVENECGITVNKYLDWRAIQGDSSDNIQGVTGVGPKTATKMFDKWGTLTGIINACKSGKETAKIATNIVAFGENRIFNNIYVMALYADRAGARLELSQCVNEYTRANRGEMKAYLVGNAFMSLLNPEFIQLMLHQNVPIIKEGIRMPMVCERRYPVE